MTERLPALIGKGKIVAISRKHIVPRSSRAAGERASLRFLAANIRNPHTRRSYGRAVAEFLAWCDDHGVPSVSAVQSLHVAAWIELPQQNSAAPTVKARLAAICSTKLGAAGLPVMRPVRWRLHQ